jgi:hypothetical protein
MRIRLSSFLFIASLLSLAGLTACVHHIKATTAVPPHKAAAPQKVIVAVPHKKNAIEKPVKPIQQTRLVAGFNHINVAGAMNVRLRTGSSKTEVILHGDSRDLTRVIVVVQNSTLSIRLPTPPKFGAVTADIHGKQLNSFTYIGGGTIKGDNINSKFLDLNISNPEKTTLSGQMNLHKLVVKGPGFVEVNGVKSPYLELVLKNRAHVKLRGYAKLARLDISGNSSFNMYWISNDWVTIRARDASVIQLAGIANKLDLELWGHARFNGRFLRVSRTFVKTHNDAVAEINSVDRQHTLATDASDIRFYNIPVLKSDFMACNGSVLDMRDWDQPYMQEYNRYNKDMPIGDW